LVLLPSTLVGSCQGRRKSCFQTNHDYVLRANYSLARVNGCCKWLPPKHRVSGAKQSWINSDRVNVAAIGGAPAKTRAFPCSDTEERGNYPTFSEETFILCTSQQLSSKFPNVVTNSKSVNPLVRTFSSVSKPEFIASGDLDLYLDSNDVIFSERNIPFFWLSPSLSCLPSWTIILESIEKMMDPPLEKAVLIDDDDRSRVSSLQCGSIPPNRDYDPAKDPSGVAFVPPLEIFVEGKVEIPAWLRPDTCDLPSRPSLNRVTSAQSDLSPSRVDLSRQVSWDSRCLDSRDILREIPGPMMEPRIYQVGHYQCQDPFRCTTSNTSVGTLHTSPTDLSGDESVGLGIVPERGTRDVKFFTGRLSLFHKRRRSVSLKRSRGCLT